MEQLMPATEVEMDTATKHVIEKWDDDRQVDLDTLAYLDMSYAAKKIQDHIRLELWQMNRYWPCWENGTMFEQ
jgi:hypothetical protein